MAASDSAPPNRRIAPRVPIVLAVEYKRLNAFFAYYTHNISRGGTFIATSKPLPLGTVFVFKLVLPGLPDPLELQGRVAHVVTTEEATESLPAGMGIEFVRDGGPAQRELDETVEALMIGALGETLYRQLIAQRR